jgi:hypothetical protein
MPLTGVYYLLGHDDDSTPLTHMMLTRSLFWSTQLNMP